MQVTLKEIVEEETFNAAKCLNFDVKYLQEMKSFITFFFFTSLENDICFMCVDLVGSEGWMCLKRE